MGIMDSNMMPLGTSAPDFKLLDTVTNKCFRLEDLKSQHATVILFICNHCPFVRHIQTELVKLAQTYQPKHISFIAISSNAIEEYPEDGPKKMHEVAKKFNYPFPYLYDETQEVAKAYQAACTPDIYVFDKDLKCVYRGQLDDSRPGSKVPVSGKDLRAALDNILAGKPVDPNQKPSQGCNIKWKKD